MATPDLTEFEQLASPNRRRPCTVGVALKQLTSEDLVKVEAALAADRSEIPTGAIEKWFGLRNLEASIPAITTHRANRCSCANG